MGIISIDVYRTTVMNGVATVSEPFTIIIDDQNDDGKINGSEWTNYTGDIYPNIGGNTSGSAALWDGSTSVLGSNSSGYLYTSQPIPTSGAAAYTEVQDILSTITHVPDNYIVSADELRFCFLSGTLIATPDGEVPVETLRAGDLVLTRDHGAQPLVWTSHSAVSREVLDRAPNLRAIRIEAGALGD